MPQFSLEDHNDISNASDRVVIVAARFALDEYLKYAAHQHWCSLPFCEVV
jgi:hypothetical protein